MTKLILSVIGLGLAGGIFFIYTQPTFDQINSAKSEISQYDDALSKAAELQQVKQTLLDKYKAFKPDDLDRLSKLLPDHVDNVRLLLDLDHLSISDQMPMQNVSIGDPNKAGGSSSALSTPDAASQKIGSLDLKFSTSGTYEQFKKFLDDLESSLRIVDVIGLQVDRGAGQTIGTPTYTFTVTARTYWLKQ